MNDLNELKKFIRNLNFEGMVRKIDELGRIVIPIDFRNGKYEEGSIVYIYVLDDYLMVTNENDFQMGIAKKFDELGRIQISKEIRDELNWEYKDSIMIWAFEGGLILRKNEGKCIFCKTKDQLNDFKNKFICYNCIKELLELKIDV